MSTSSPRVMVVDDHPEALYVTVQLLMLLGCAVQGYPDGENCLFEIENVRPHLLLLDLALPRTSGIAVADFVWNLKLDPMPMVVAVTGYGDPQTVANCMAAGFDEHELKPISYERLSALVCQARQRFALPRVSG